MFRKNLSLARHYLLRKKGSSPGARRLCRRPPDDGTVPVDDIRAVATETALASAADVSPAALVSLWAQDERLHRPRGRRTS